MHRTDSLPFTTLLLATGNTGKTAELRKLLSGIEVELIDLSSFPSIESVHETGSTFRENAEIKASGYAKATGMYAVADDSGLEVFALGGEPGVHSARYGGPDLDDRGRINLLLEKMLQFTENERSAQFTASISLARPNGKILFTCEASCPGSIAQKPSGVGGFGYDPVFLPDGYSETFGELSADVKDKISHRSKATRLFIRFLLDFTGF
jgi:XTP/dITP diphosphohydrolase